MRTGGAGVATLIEQVVVGFHLAVDLPGGGLAVQIESGIAQRGLRGVVEQTVHRLSAGDALRVDVDRAAGERGSPGAGIDPGAHVVLHHHRQDRAGARAAFGPGGNRTGNGPSQYARGAVGGDIEPVETGRLAAEPLGLDLVGHHADDHRATRRSAFAAGAGKGAATDQQARAVIGSHTDAVDRCFALGDFTVLHRRARGVANHRAGGGNGYPDVGLAAGGDGQTEAHGDLISAAGRLDLQQVVGIEFGVVQQRLGDVEQVVVSDGAGNSRAEITLLAASQGQSARAGAAELIGLVKREHGDLAALERVSRIEDDIAQMRAGLLPGHVERQRAGNRQADLAARLLLTAVVAATATEHALELVPVTFELVRYFDDGVLYLHSLVLHRGEARADEVDAVGQRLGDRFPEATCQRRRPAVGAAFRGVGFVLLLLLLGGARHRAGDREGTDLARALCIDQHFIHAPLGLGQPGATRAELLDRAPGTVVADQGEHIGGQHVDRHAGADAGVFRRSQRAGSGPNTDAMIGSDADLVSGDCGAVVHRGVHGGVDHADHHRTAGRDGRALAGRRADTDDQLILFGVNVQPLGRDRTVGANSGDGLIVGDLDVDTGAHSAAV